MRTLDFVYKLSFRSRNGEFVAVSDLLKGNVSNCAFATVEEMPVIICELCNQVILRISRHDVLPYRSVNYCVSHPHNRILPAQEKDDLTYLRYASCSSLSCSDQSPARTRTTYRRLGEWPPFCPPNLARQPRRIWSSC